MIVPDFTPLSYMPGYHQAMALLPEARLRYGLPPVPEFHLRPRASPYVVTPPYFSHLRDMQLTRPQVAFTPEMRLSTRQYALTSESRSLKRQNIQTEDCDTDSPTEKLPKYKLLDLSKPRFLTSPKPSTCLSTKSSDNWTQSPLIAMSSHKLTAPPPDSTPLRSIKSTDTPIQKSIISNSNKLKTSIPLVIPTTRLVTSPPSVSKRYMSGEDGSLVDDDEGSPTGSGDRKAFKCPQCMYFTDRKNNLKRHVVTMHQECSKNLECCGVAFHSKAALRDHVALFHKGGYRCQICNRNFCRKALLRRHLTVHSGRKDFSCRMCGYATSHKSNLERHQRVHFKRATTTYKTENDVMDKLELVHNNDNIECKQNLVSDGLPMRQKPSNRFVLLPNRIKYTHSETNDIPRRRQQCETKHYENEGEYTKEFDFCLSLSNDKSNDNKDKPVPKIKRRSCVFSKQRIFVTPYKCNDCGGCFSKQTDLYDHNCQQPQHSSAFSVITEVRKGHIKLLEQKDTGKDTQPQGEDETEIDVIKVD